MSALIAIVGRPNVGKSALFNRIVGKRIAIVHNEPGVTRDRVTAEAEWKGRSFTLVDTGGIGLAPGENTADVLAAAALAQVEIAIQAAQVLILVVNIQEGLVPLDVEVASRLRRSGKPVLVAINKADNPQAEANLADFARLGYDQLFPISAIHERGIDSLMQAALDLLPSETPSISNAEAGSENDHPPGPEGPLRIAIVGRPNVGKSSLTNALTQSDRVIVTPIPGTTRDAVEVPFDVVTQGVRQRYILIDTAGVRKRRRVDTSIEFFSVKRSEDTIQRCDLVVFLLDAEAGILEQDKKICDLIVAARKPCLVVVNKWDLFLKQAAEAEKKKREHEQKMPRRKSKSQRLTALQEFGQWVQQKLFFLDYAPVIFASAQSGLNLDRILDAVRYVTAQLTQKIPTAILNRTLHEAIESRQPTSVAGHRLKFFYATQIHHSPPTFLLFVNRPDLFSPAYNKYLVDSLRRAFGYEGCPLVLIPRARPRTIEPKRKHSPTRPH